ncbi:MAG: hypothetical protein Q9182_007483 [Xanthomendoza sp. 2 TL-2023]
MYGEGSGPNKRPRGEPEAPPVSPLTPPQAPNPPASQPQPQFPFPVTEPTRDKKKGQKRTGKRAEPLPLVGMMNDTQGSFKKPVSIRQVLKDNKVDMSFMDFMAWSPSACKELKRLCTRVTNKNTKPQPPVQPGPQPVPFTSSGFGFVPVAPQAGQVPQYPINIPAMQPTNIQPAQPTQSAQAPQQTFSYTEWVQQGQQAPTPPATQTQGGATSVEVRSLGTTVDVHTRSLGKMAGMEKAFRIPCTVRVNGKDIQLERDYTQADQGPEMNIISSSMAHSLGLQLHDLSAIGFYGLSMKRADHKETTLHHWIWLEIGVEGI